MNRVAFSIFGIDVMWYGILIAIGMMLAILISSREAKRVDFDENSVVDLSIFLLPLSIVGARLYYVIFNWDLYSQDLSQIINTRGGGLAIHGGIIVGIIVTFLYTKLKKINFFKFSDVIVLGLPLAQAIGRWGNFINQEAHGGPTDLPWGIIVEGQKVHPTFLYESIWNVMVFALIFYKRKNKEYDGQLLAYYLVLYSLGRFFIEGLRTDSLMLGPLRVAQVISLLGIACGLIVHLILKKRGKDGI